METTPKHTDNPDTDESTKGTRATKEDVASRLARVRRWIRDEGMDVNVAVERMQELYGISRRQALRYWVRGYRPLLSDEDRRRSDRPRDKRGRYRPWPSLSYTFDDVRIK